MAKRKVIAGKPVLTELTPDAFVKALKGEKVLDLKGKNLSFYHTSYTDSEKKKWSNSVIVKDVVIPKWANVGSPNDERLFFPHPILIEGGSFQGLSFTKCRFEGNVNIKGGEFFGSVLMYQCHFNRDFRIYEGVFHDFFMVNLSKFKAKFFIHGGQFNKDFQLSRGIFSSYVSFFGGHFEKMFKIDGCVFDDLVQFNQTVSGGTQLREGKYKNGVKLVGGQYEPYFSVYSGAFSGPFVIDGGKSIGALNIRGGEYSKSLTISGGDFNSIYIVNSEDSPFPSLVIQNLVMQKVFTNELTVSNSIISTIYLNGIVKDTASIYLKELEVNSLKFGSDFKNEGTISISRLVATDMNSRDRLASENKHKQTSEKIRTKLLFDQCDLGSTVFLNSKLDSFDLVMLYQSRFNEINLVHCQIPLKSEDENKVYSNIIEEGDETVFIDSSSELAETYSHLQLAMQKLGNRTWEMKYNAEYLHWHLKDAVKKKNNTLVLNLFLNKWSTKFGNNWLRGVGRTLRVSVIFYIMYICTLPSEAIKPDFQFWESIFYHLGKLGEFILPTHKFNFMTQDSSGLPSVIDFLSRIGIGYMLYQTIAAFRRFGKV